jgi:ferrous iron transport protein B
MSDNRTDIPKIALAGNPNCGKTALFNAITGGRAKVGNYPGVTVERKEGSVSTPTGKTLSMLDLPGTYSLDARTLDEMVTREILLDHNPQEGNPDFLIAVADATNLERSLGLIMELKELKKPMLLALNMMDLAEQRGLEIDLQTLSEELKIPVVPTVATKKKGIPELLSEIEKNLEGARTNPENDAIQWEKPSLDAIRNRFAEIDRVLSRTTRRAANPTVWNDRIDRVVLHPVWGSLILVLVFGLVFQAVFTWAQTPMEWIKLGVESLGAWVTLHLSEGPLQSLLVDGVIAGVGSVITFLPQILLLFLFILFLEDSGYMPRAAFLMDRLMGKVGLHGRDHGDSYHRKPQRSTCYDFGGSTDDVFSAAASVFSFNCGIYS